MQIFSHVPIKTTTTTTFRIASTSWVCSYRNSFHIFHNVLYISYNATLNYNKTFIFGSCSRQDDTKANQRFVYQNPPLEILHEPPGNYKPSRGCYVICSVKTLIHMIII